jgi:predicted acylesterase/phospholipase RssA/CRP-like cAMP-binding protein
MTAELLRRSELFSTVSDEALDAIARDCETVHVPGRRLVFARGAASDGMYIVIRGRLLVVDDDSRVLWQVGRGEHVGELSLLTGAPRSANVRTARDSTLLRIPPEAFRHALEAHSGLALSIARALSGIISRGDASVSTQVSTIAIVPGEREGEVRLFGEQLARALAPLGTVTVVDRARVAQLEPTGEMTDLLDRLEAEHTFTVFLTDQADTSWTQRCLRQADVVLEVAAGAEQLRDAANVTLEPDVPRELVVMRSSTPRPVAARLASGRYRAHHFVREGSALDFARLARFLAGRAHGLALSGGSNRTSAYLGVFRALAESGVPIDVVAGTSGGALLGAMLALGWDHAQMREGLRQMERAPLWRDLGPPLLSVMSGRTYERLLRDLFGDARLEDLATPFLPVCARLRDGAVVTPERGEIWRAVRASTSLPGIWPPVERDGELLVDGGISNNLPVDLARARCGAGTVIACDVSEGSAFEGMVVGETPSGWSLLAARLWPFGERKRTVGIIDVVVSATCAPSTRAQAEAIAAAALYVQLRAGAESSVDALVTRGYEATRAALDAMDQPALARLGVRASLST